MGTMLVRNIAQTCYGTLQRRLPIHLAPVPALADHGLLRAVRRIYAFIREAVAVGNPRFVDGFVGTRHHAHQLAAQHVAVKVAAHAVVRRHHGVLGHFPTAALEAERLGVQRTDRAQVDEVAGQLMVHGLLDERADFRVLATAKRAE